MKGKGRCEFLTQLGTSSRSTLNYARLLAMTRQVIPTYRGWTRAGYARHARELLVNSPRNESVTACSHFSPPQHVLPCHCSNSTAIASLSDNHHFGKKLRRRLRRRSTYKQTAPMPPYILYVYNILYVYYMYVCSIRSRIPHEFSMRFACVRSSSQSFVFSLALL